MFANIQPKRAKCSTRWLRNTSKYSIKWLRFSRYLPQKFPEFIVLKPSNFPFQIKTFKRIARKHAKNAFFAIKSMLLAAFWAILTAFWPHSDLESTLFRRGVHPFRLVRMIAGSRLVIGVHLETNRTACSCELCRSRGVCTERLANLRARRGRRPLFPTHAN